MAGPVLGTPLRSAKFYDTIGAGAIYYGTQYNCVSELNATEAANFPHSIEYSPDGAGIKMTNTGNPAGVIERVKGIAENSAQSGTQLAYRTGPGVANVMAGAAVARGVWVGCTLNEQKADNVAPMLNLADPRMPIDPRFTVTYSLAMVGAMTPTQSTTGATNLNYLNVGFSEQAAVNKYDIIGVDLFLNVFYS